MPKEIGGEIMYTLGEIEDLLLMPATTLRDLINQEKIKAKKIDDEWLISEAALSDYLDTKARQT